MKIYLVTETVTLEAPGGGEHEVETTIAVYTSPRLADAVALRGGWSVRVMDSDPEFRDSWFCHLSFDGSEVECIGPSPVQTLPESKADPWKTGVYGYGWTEQEAREAARRIYDTEVAEGYKKLMSGIEERKKRLGLL